MVSTRAGWKQDLFIRCLRFALFTFRAKRKPDTLFAEGFQRFLELNILEVGLDLRR
jgi:hypothetical protein